MPASDPNVQPRAAWGAGPTPATDIRVPTAELWLHHTGPWDGSTGVAAMRKLRDIAYGRGYIDIDYTVVVDPSDCSVWEARGVGKNSAATLNHNQVSHAICVLGDYQDPHGAIVAPELVACLGNLVAWGFERGWWKECRLTGPHRDVYPTACCGVRLIDHIAEINGHAFHTHMGTEPAPPDEDEMKLFLFRIPDAKYPANVWLSDGLWRRLIRSPADLAAMQFIHGIKTIGTLPLAVAKAIPRNDLHLAA
jgi:hypothetical protein